MNSYTGTMEKNRAYRDGDFEATLYELVVETAGVPILIPHGLGRAVNQVQVVKATAAITHPLPALDSARREINDAEKIGLIFDAAPVTVRLRFA